MVAVARFQPFANAQVRLSFLFEGWSMRREVSHTLFGEAGRILIKFHVQILVWGGEIVLRTLSGESRVLDTRILWMTAIS